MFGRLLQLDTYLLSRRDLESSSGLVEAMAGGAEANEGDDEIHDAANGGNEPDNLADRHQALLMMREPQDEEHYERPPHFVLRLAALIACLVITLIVVSAFVLVVPGKNVLTLTMSS